METFCLDNSAGFLWTMVGKFLWIFAYFNTHTLFQIIVPFAFYLTAYNFRIPGCNYNHIVKVTAPLQHHARVSRPDNVLYLKAICTPISKPKQTNISCTTHNVSSYVSQYAKEPCCFYFASSKLLLPNGDTQKSPVVTSLLLLKVTTYFRQKEV